MIFRLAGQIECILHDMGFACLCLSSRFYVACHQLGIYVASFHMYMQIVMHFGKS